MTHKVPVSVSNRTYRDWSVRDAVLVAAGIDDTCKDSTTQLDAESQTDTDTEHHQDSTHHDVSMPTPSCCNPQHQNHTDHLYKHHDTLNHHPHHCLDTGDTADAGGGNHGNLQDADESPSEYVDIYHSDGTCQQHADWWKHKVTCH